MIHKARAKRSGPLRPEQPTTHAMDVPAEMGCGGASPGAERRDEDIAHFNNPFRCASSGVDICQWFERDRSLDECYLQAMIAMQPELSGMPEPAPLRKGTGAWAKHELSRFELISIAEGGLMPPAVAAELMGLSRVRVAQFMETGQLTRFEIADRPYVSVKQVEGLLAANRPTGVHGSRKDR